MQILYSEKAEKRNDPKYKKLFDRMDNLKLYELKDYFEAVYNEIKSEINMIFQK